MSGTTGAAGGAAPGGVPYGGAPQPPAEKPAASTSLMSAVGSGGGFGGTPAPGQPAGGSGYSTPTTYTKGQPAPTPARGTRTGAGQGGAARRPGAGPAVPAPAAGGTGLAGRTRKARLRLLRADPWSVMKVSFLLSVAIGVIIIVAAAVLWMTLDALGVFASLGKTLKEITGSDTSGGVNLMDYIGFGQVLGYTSLLAVIDVVLMTALCTLASFIYNAAAGFSGGIELTLAEEE
ncbi:DUF3566 domain-containing protein [Kitasatospora sp. NPDC052896]|uniref:DUF3566 domain-containing protein n=1 Tax=Kitasatospora sp. NPDC052896 TaxID=3364061 RepID=UPI0037C7F4A6